MKFIEETNHVICDDPETGPHYPTEEDQWIKANAKPEKTTDHHIDPIDPPFEDPHFK